MRETRQKYVTALQQVKSLTLTSYLVLDNVVVDNSCRRINTRQTSLTNKTKSLLSKNLSARYMIVRDENRISSRAEQTDPVTTK
ncbi:uncharacterized protein BO88DRAFT_400926 [Aspergillus vadensis CBS 113365]|uniref:Uncharacterized protein n=1 Tax=Aspergillus vadensis (strain CBS 113365 / IMI 142717 / IBT 24658) TaxID=1448311 RepID=A0A319BKQ5_ASPVC|nr:hypothetical protein BO88DRAFT_400926 [Aspergillus vadensis CBS 113365]PYH73287.1 hypothetical protein BO88DRAFT_400926 [Aspergillus vadensis CBS 113365]